jgi:hypothetical protein
MFRALFFALTLILPALATAQAGDAQEVGRYVLSNAGLAKYKQATQKLSAIGVGDCGQDDGDDSDAPSISAAAAKIDANPAARSAIQSAGMTSREFIVFGMSMLQSGLAAWGMDQPGGKLPPGVSMANVTFYRAHADEIAQLGEAAQSACSGDEGEEEQVEED